MSFIEQAVFSSYSNSKKLLVAKIKPPQKNSYTSAVQKLVSFLRKHNLRVLAMVLGTLLHEPWQAIKAGFSSIASWKKHFNFHEMNPKALTVEQLSQQPILLIHGNYHNQSAWLSLAKKLKNKNLGPVYTVNLPNGAITHKDFEIIQRKMEQIKEQYTQGLVRDIEINIVGHSRGGDIARQLALANPFRHFSIGKVITIGTASTQEDLLSLRKFGHRIFEVTGKQDILVTNPSLLPAKNNEAVDIGHLELLYCSKVHKRIIEWLSF